MACQSGERSCDSFACNELGKHEHSQWCKGFPGPEGVLQDTLASGLHSLDDLFIGELLIRPLGKRGYLPQCYAK